jgi:hypothetical protein
MKMEETYTNPVRVVQYRRMNIRLYKSDPGHETRCIFFFALAINHFYVGGCKLFIWQPFASSHAFFIPAIDFLQVAIYHGHKVDRECEYWSGESDSQVRYFLDSIICIFH